MLHISTCKNHNVITFDSISDFIVKGFVENLKIIDQEITNLKNVVYVAVKLQKQFGHSTSKSHMVDCGKVDDVKDEKTRVSHAGNGGASWH